MELEALTLHKHWTNGILPEAGGLLDQAAAYEVVILATDMGVAHGTAVRQEVAQRKANLADRKQGSKGTARRTKGRRG